MCQCNHNWDFSRGGVPLRIRLWSPAAPAGGWRIGFGSCTHASLLRSILLTPHTHTALLGGLSAGRDKGSSSNRAPDETPARGNNRNNGRPPPSEQTTEVVPQPGPGPRCGKRPSGGGGTPFGWASGTRWLPPEACGSGLDAALLHPFFNMSCSLNAPRASWA